MTLLRGAQPQDKRQQPHTGTREMSFYREGGQALDKFPQEDVEFPSLEILRTGQDPEQPDLTTLQRVGLETLPGGTSLGHLQWLYVRVWRFS